MSDLRTYKEKVSEFENRINSFRALPCNITRITKDIIRIDEAMKDADRLYMNLSEDMKEKELNTFLKSNELVKKYQLIMRNLDKVCECKPFQIE